jgi:hypothetical protein
MKDEYRDNTLRYVASGFGGGIVFLIVFFKFLDLVFYVSSVFWQVENQGKAIKALEARIERLESTPSHSAPSERPH